MHPSIHPSTACALLVDSGRNLEGERNQTRDALSQLQNIWEGVSSAIPQMFDAHGKYMFSSKSFLNFLNKTFFGPNVNSFLILVFGLLVIGFFLPIGSHFIDQSNNGKSNEASRQAQFGKSPSQDLEDSLIGHI